MSNLVYLSAGLVMLVLVLILFQSMPLGADGNESFKANSNLTNHALMDFTYLTNKNYANNIAARYYLNDDARVGGARVVNHPYMYSYGGHYGYGWSNPGWSNGVYRNTGVRL